MAAAPPQLPRPRLLVRWAQRFDLVMLTVEASCADGGPGARLEVSADGREVRVTGTKPAEVQGLRLFGRVAALSDDGSPDAASPSALHFRLAKLPGDGPTWWPRLTEGGPEDAHVLPVLVQPDWARWQPSPHDEGLITL